MKKEVKVSISGLQDEERTEVDVFVPGIYFLRDGMHYIKYTEKTEAGDCPTENLIKYGGASLEVQKKGNVNTKMVFETGRKTETLYRTPFGDLQMTIFTKSLHLTETKEGLEIRAEYQLEMSESYRTDCRIKISVQFS